MASFDESNSVIQLSGGREMVNEARAKELLQSTVFPTDPSILKLSNKSYSPEAASVLVESIQKFNSILIADISDIIAGRPEEEALRTLKVFCEGLCNYPLIEINLSDNALGNKGINSCVSILVIKSIQRLYLCNNGLSAEASSNIAEILLVNGCPPLTHLHFYNNMAGTDGAKAIAKVVSACPKLRDFRFSATRSGDEGCAAIAQALITLTDLEKLDLSDNNFSTDAATALASSVKNLVNLRYLNLRDAGLEDEGITALLESLDESNAPLQFLDLSGNDLSQDCMISVSKYLANRTTIEELSFDDNEIETEGLKYLIEAIKSLNNLKTISFCTCDITAAGAFLLAKTVASIQNFKLLKIDGNLIVERGIKEIKRILNDANKELGELEDNDVDGEDDLDEVLNDNIDRDDDDELSNSLANVKINS